MGVGIVHRKVLHVLQAERARLPDGHEVGEPGDTHSLLQLVAPGALRRGLRLGRGQRGGHRGEGITRRRGGAGRGVHGLLGRRPALAQRDPVLDASRVGALVDGGAGDPLGGHGGPGGIVQRLLGGGDRLGQGNHGGPSSFDVVSSSAAAACSAAAAADCSCSLTWRRHVVRSGPVATCSSASRRRRWDVASRSVLLATSASAASNWSSSRASPSGARTAASSARSAVAAARC